MDSQVAGNDTPLYLKVDHSWFKVAQNYEPLALQVYIPVIVLPSSWGSLLGGSQGPFLLSSVQSPFGLKPQSPRSRAPQKVGALQTTET